MAFKWYVLKHPNKSCKWGQLQEKVTGDALTFCSVVIIHVISTSGVRRRRHEKEPVDRNLVIQPPSKPISSGLWASQVGCKLPAYKCAAFLFFFLSSRLGRARDNKEGSLSGKRWNRDLHSRKQQTAVAAERVMNQHGLTKRRANICSVPDALTKSESLQTRAPTLCK